LGKINSDFSFRVFTEFNEFIPILEKLYNSNKDAPVFYSSGMLNVYQTISSKKIEAAVLFENNQPQVALPIVFQNYYQNVSYPGWDNLNVLYSDGTTDETLSVFWSELLKHCGFVKLSNLTEEVEKHFNDKKIKAIVVPMRKCPYVPVHNTWEEQNEILSKKLVRNLRQYGNKAQRNGISFAISKATDVSLEERIKKLKIAFAYHDKRMDVKDMESKFTDDNFSDYHRQIMNHPNHVFFIEAFNAEKVNIACFYGFYNNSRLAYFNGGFNLDYTKLSLGTLLVKELVNDCIERGLSKFDFLRGNETYKTKWTKEFDLNKTIYLGKTNFSDKAKMYQTYFQDTRKRVGGKAAIQRLFQQIVSTNPVTT